MGIQVGIVPGRRSWVTGGLSVLFVLCWASGFIGAKLGAAEAPVTTLLAWRFLPLAIVLVLFVRVTQRGPSSGSPAGEVGRHVLVGLLSQSGYLLTVYWAIGLGVSTGTTALIDGVQPLVAAALVGPLLGVVVNGRQWAGLVLGLAGVALVCWTDAASSGGHAPAWAYLLPFAGMLSLVGSTFLERRARRAIPALRALAIHCSTSAVVFVALALATGTFMPPASAAFWVATAWLVLLSTFGGYGLYWLLVERIGVTPVNSLMFLIAPVTSVWGALMFGEPLTGVTAFGLALTLVGALVASRDDERSLREQRRPDGGSGEGTLLAPDRNHRQVSCGRLSYRRDPLRCGSRRRSWGLPGTEEKCDDALPVERARPRRDGRVRQLRLQGGDGRGVRRDQRLQ